MAFKRRAEPTTIDEERAALREQYVALEDLKQELAERVAAVRERELELRELLAEAGNSSPLRGAQDLDTDENAFAAAQRERDLLEREQRLTDREGLLAGKERALDTRERELEEQALTARGGQPDSVPVPTPEPGAARLAEIEARLAELRDAEKLFLRTRDELAARSEAVAARERLVAQKERELDERDDTTEPWDGPGFSEMEARLRRLEQQQQPGEQTLGFSGGLKKLQQGTKRPQ